MDCKTPSNPLGLEAAYDIPKGIVFFVFYWIIIFIEGIGQSLTISDILELTNKQLQLQEKSSNVDNK
jgi:hypothetical protein